MADESSVGADLVSFAQVLVRQLIKKHRLRWGSNRIEDAEQELVIAGWQVWSDPQDAGLAKNRMVSRQKNLLRDFISESHHEPKAGSDRLDRLAGDKGRKLWNEDAVRDSDNASSLACSRDDSAANVAFEQWHIRCRETPQPSAPPSSPHRYSSMFADQSGGPFRFKERTTSRNDASPPRPPATPSTVTRTRVFGASPGGLAARNTCPSKTASMVSGIAMNPQRAVMELKSSSPGFHATGNSV